MQLQYADEMLARAAEHGLEFFRMMALIERGWSLAALERAEEGIPLLAAALAGWRDQGFVVFRPWALTLLADACRMDGQLQPAIEHLAEARRLAEATEARLCRVMLDQCLVEMSEGREQHGKFTPQQHELIDRHQPGVERSVRRIIQR